ESDASHQRDDWVVHILAELLLLSCLMGSNDRVKWHCSRESVRSPASRETKADTAALSAGLAAALLREATIEAYAAFRRARHTSRLGALLPEVFYPDRGVPFDAGSPL